MVTSNLNENSCRLNIQHVIHKSKESFCIRLSVTLNLRSKAVEKKLSYLFHLKLWKQPNAISAVTLARQLVKLWKYCSASTRAFKCLSRYLYIILHIVCIYIHSTCTYVRIYTHTQSLKTTKQPRLRQPEK